MTSNARRRKEGNSDAGSRYDTIHTYPIPSHTILYSSRQKRQKNCRKRVSYHTILTNFWYHTHCLPHVRRCTTRQRVVRGRVCAFRKKIKYKDVLDNPLKDLVKFIHKRHVESSSLNHCSGIVYVHKRSDTTMIANAINRGNHNTTSIRAEPYHAGLKDAQRTQIQQAWSNNQIQVAVATVAF